MHGVAAEDQGCHQDDPPEHRYVHQGTDACLGDGLSHVRVGRLGPAIWTSRANGTVKSSRAAWSQRMSARSLNETADPTRIEPTMKAAEPVPRTQPDSNPGCVALRGIRLANDGQ